MLYTIAFTVPFVPFRALLPNNDHFLFITFQLTILFAIAFPLLSFTIVNVPPTYNNWLIESNANDFTTPLVPLEVVVPNGDHTSLLIFHAAISFAFNTILDESYTCVKLPPQYTILLILSYAYAYIVPFVPFDAYPPIPLHCCFVIFQAATLFNDKSICVLSLTDVNVFPPTYNI